MHKTMNRLVHDLIIIFNAFAILENVLNESTWGKGKVCYVYFQTEFLLVFGNLDSITSDYPSIRYLNQYPNV